MFAREGPSRKIRTIIGKTTTRCEKVKPRYSEYSRQSTIILIDIATRSSSNFRAWTILAECKANPNPPTHRLFTLPHKLHILLFLLYLCIFSHILWGGKVIVISCVNFGVESGNERCPDTAKIIPFYILKERVAR